MLSALLTVVVAVIEIMARSFGGEGSRADWSLRACLTRAVAAYVFVSAMWNLAGSLVALYLLRVRYEGFAEWLGVADYLLAVIVGVLALGFLLNNTDVVMFNRTVSAYYNWVPLLRGPAVRSVQHKRSQRKQDLQRELESALKGQVPREELQTHLLDRFGPEELAEMEQRAKEQEADPVLYKAMQLAERHPDQAWSLVRHWSDKG